MIEDDLKRRIEEYRRDPLLNFLQAKIELIHRTRIPSYLLKDGVLTVLPFEEVTKIEAEMKERRHSKYSDLFPL